MTISVRDADGPVMEVKFSLDLLPPPTTRVTEPTAMPPAATPRDAIGCDAPRHVILHASRDATAKRHAHGRDAPTRHAATAPAYLGPAHGVRSRPAAVGVAINGWYARSLGASDVAGWLFLALGVAAELERPLRRPPWL